MELKPVRKYSAPSYPTRDYLSEHPEFLRLVPERWQSNKLVLATLGVVAMLVTACHGENTRVAPIFVHGNGRGGFGCVAVNPPVVLTEDEARQIILDEAGKAGLHFSDTTFVLKGTLPMAADGYDPSRRIAFEYVSLSDERAWTKARQEALNKGRVMVESSAWGADVHAVADSIRTDLTKTSTHSVIGIFYDPMIGSMDEWRALSKEERDEYVQQGKSGHSQQPHHLSEQQLRLQVRDFIAWLKTEGII